MNKILDRGKSKGGSYVEKEGLRTAVIALGGNAILQSGQRGTFEEQAHNVDNAVGQIISIIKEGYRVILTHGNGPQVGNILIQNEEASDLVPAMPLDVCGAKTQGLIGYMIQNSLRRQLNDNEIKASVVTVITQVKVNKEDPAFSNPTKPVGPFYSADKAKRFIKEKGEAWVEDSNRGWRKVVPSPEPIDIIEKDVISKLVEEGVIVIASGGGGIPVIEDSKGNLKGIEAVIDKDLAGQKLAQGIEADLFMILTDVSNASLNYSKTNEKKLHKVSLSDIRKYSEEGHFKAGSMAPKVEACMKFVEECGKPAVISSLDESSRAISFHVGTVIFPDEKEEVIIMDS